jgi:hypothetical protein
MPPVEAYSNYRKYLNAQLHVVSLRISGDDSALRSFLAQFGVSSVLELSDKQAEALLARMRSVADDFSKKEKQNDFGHRTSNQSNGMSEQQRRKIIRLTKYVLCWTPGGTFSFIIDNRPLLRDRLTRWEVQNSKLNKLYKAMSFKDADFIIKKLEKIEERDTISDIYFEMLYQFLLLPKRVNMVTAKISWLTTITTIAICIISLLFLGWRHAR